MPTIIYDIGANNGDDVPYYLLKADKVVAVEANPDLCDRIRNRFPDDIAAGRLAIECCVVVGEDSSDTVAFHVHKTYHVLSRRSAPWRRRDEYAKVVLPAKSIGCLLREHGEPTYVKVDIEGGEGELIRALFARGVYPAHLSAEAHRIEAFLRIAATGTYDGYQLVEGHRVADQFRDHPVTTRSGTVRYSFPPHSAGPYGDDIGGEWVDAETMFRRLISEGLGWKDIHARRRDAARSPAPGVVQRKLEYASRRIRWYLRRPLNRLSAVFSRS